MSARPRPHRRCCPQPQQQEGRTAHLPPAHARQIEVGPHLTRLETEWVGAVKKNLEIEGHCMRLETECAALQKRLSTEGK